METHLKEIIKKISGHSVKNTPENYDHYKDQYWNNLNRVQEYINERATGNKDQIWQIDIKTRFKEYIPFDDVLVIGCGNGWVERQLYDLGLGIHFDAFDISEKYLYEAKKLADNRDINYFKADINHLENIAKSKYNAIFNVGVLHHTFRLSHAVWNLATALKQDGLLFNFDYVGPSRNQYSDEHVKIMKEVMLKMPKRFQTKHSLRPPLKNFQAEPSEAIHSDLVRGTVERFFDTTYQRDINGGIAYQILWNNIDEFKKNDEEAIRTLEYILEEDAKYTKLNKVPVLFWYSVGKPKPRNQIKYFEILPP